MNIKKPLLLLSALFALAMPFGGRSFTMAKADNEQNRVWLDTEAEVLESYSYSASLWLKNYEEISALSIEIHFNPQVMSVSDAYNSISTTIYDSSITEESVNFTYIFDNLEIGCDQQLFYFYYSILNGVTPGTYYFDILISEAYNSSLEDVEISANRYFFNVSSKASMKSSYAYPNSNNISTSYSEEFEFTYYLNNSEPTSGVFDIRYDDTLFEFVSLTKLSFFDNMICDYNASAKGEILVTFAEVVPDSKTTLFKVRLRTIKNVTENTQISLSANELYDSDMNPMNFSAENINVSISYDSSYEEKPSVTTIANIDTSKQTVIFTINLEENSHLGAGDFVFKFDKDLLTYDGYKKLISPTFFNVNDKDAQLVQGQIKFSILSTTDITSGGNILSIAFSYSNARDNRNSSVILTGKGLTDSLTNTIELNISGTNFVIPGVDLVQIWIDSYMYMDDPSFAGAGTGRCVSDKLYETAKKELMKLDADSRDDFENDVDHKYTSALNRYLAWAKANHDNSPFTPDYDFLNSSKSTSLSDIGESNSTIYILIAITAISMTACCLLILKKKHNK